jgi:hypothetical protein
MFNYVLLTLWYLDYGWMEGARRYLRDFHNHDGQAAHPPESAPPPEPLPAARPDKVKAKKRK